MLITASSQVESGSLVNRSRTRVPRDPIRARNISRFSAGISHRSASPESPPIEAMASARRRMPRATARRLQAAFSLGRRTTRMTTRVSAVASRTRRATINQPRAGPRAGIAHSVTA
ncbi:hypothetical protein [Microbacterium sp. T32]|uniref:hypothetical protein n=1 Tax=Microbacterium sp. T32 TaxID=1776083 RepID=UPI0012E80D48|nr:hypothetical protein [Microbacterium sp. T32]